MLVTIDDAVIRAAIKAMIEFGESVLKDVEIDDETDPLTTLKNIKEPEVYATGTRKSVSNALPASPQTTLFLDAAKYGKVCLLANYLCELSSHILFALQNSDLTSSFSRGRIDKDPLEGVSIKNAARALTALDLLCKFVNADTEGSKKWFDVLLKSLKIKKQDSSETEEEHVARNGLKAFNRKLPSEDTDINALLEMAIDSTPPTLDIFKQKVEALLIKLTTNNAIIAGFIGSLFDYKREIKFNIDDIKRLSTNKITKAQLESTDKKDRRYTVGR